MKKSADTGAGPAGLDRRLRLAACAVLGTCAVVPTAWAQDSAQSPTELLVAQAQGEPALRVQVQTSTLPRLEASDSGFKTSRVDVSLFPSAPGNLGALFGMSGFSARQTPQALGLQQQRPSVDFGFRWSQRLQSQQVDITAWRRMNIEDDAYSLVQSHQPVYGARVEMNLDAGRKSLFAAERGFIGMQLEGGGKISIKRSNGTPMLYYRNQF